MSDNTSSLDYNGNQLTPERFSDWKDICQDKILGLDAWDIMKGTETEPTGATAEALRSIRDFKGRKNKGASYIRGTLDHLQKTVVAHLAINDLPGIWDALLAKHETKDTNSRLLAVQQLLNLRKGDAGHESENYSTFGARCMSAANLLRNLLPPGASVTPASMVAAIGTGITTAAVLTPEVLTQGFSATNLVDELGIGMIIIGLGNSNDEHQLKHTLTHMGVDTVDRVLEELKKADNLVRSDELANPGSSGEALLAKAKGKSTRTKKHCTEHPDSTTHDTKDCITLKRRKEKADSAKKSAVAKKAKKDEKANAAESDTSDAEAQAADQAMIASAAHLASPPLRRAKNSSANTTWNPDSGATSHMTPHRAWIRDMETCRIPIRLANNDVVWALGKGSVAFTPVISGKPSESVVFQRVLYVPELQNNLFSVLYAVRHGKLRVVIENDRMTFAKDGKIIFTGSILHNVGTLNGFTLLNTETALLSQVSRDRLHQRLGHIGKDRLETMLSEGLANGISVDPTSTITDFCEHCISGKQHRNAIPHSTLNRSDEVLGRIHSDLHGPLPKTASGYQYWVSFIDDCSRFKRIFLLKKKSETFQAFQEYVAESERELGRKVKELRDDKGGEYSSNEMRDWCKSKGITRQHTTTATPSQNGVAERLNRTLAEGIIAMLNQANLPESFWGAAANYLVHILNATPSSSTSKTTSFEVWKGRKPDLTLYRTFGCRAWVHVLKKDRTAFGSHTRRCIFIGFTDGYKGWKVYEPSTRKIFTSRDVLFDETIFPGTSTRSTDEPPAQLNIHTFWPDDEPNIEDAANPDDQGPPGPPAPDPPGQIPPPIPPPTPPSHPPSDHDGFSPSWEEGKNRTGRALNQLTPPRYATVEPQSAGPSPGPSQRVGARANSPESPIRSRAPRYSDVVRSPPRSPPQQLQALQPRPVRRAQVQPLVARSSRPIRAGRVMDYVTLGGGRRRGTQPAERREIVDAEEDELEHDNVVIGHGGLLFQGGEPEWIPQPDQGGVQENDPLPPLPSDDEDDEANQAREPSIVESVNFVYGLCQDYIEWLTGYEIAFETVAERAFGAATRPEDAPASFAHAMAGPDAAKWKEATQAEIDALLANGTWELVPLPKGRKAIGSRWVFLIKRKSDGLIDRYKARLVAQGYGQRPGIDFDEVFAPTARMAAIRGILAQAALAGDHIESIDISNAYLNGELEKEYEVYMRQPEGFIQSGPNGEHWVCRLVKGLYGLKQSGRLWYHKLAQTLEELGFTQVKSAPSIYVWKSDETRVILPIFVDDVTIASPSKTEIDRIKRLLGERFKIKDLGPISYLLGIKVDYNRKSRCLKLSQSQYIIDMLSRFNLSDCKGVSTPMDPGSQLSRKDSPSTPEEISEMKKVPYMNAVGALMYLAIASRPDIAFAVGKLARFNSNPGRVHWKAVQHLFRYLQRTIDLKLTYQPDASSLSSEIMVAYSDSDFAGCTDTRRSTSGTLVKMGTGAISWSSKKQTTVAASSTEAEYAAAVATGKEVLWLRSLLQELHFPISDPSLFFIDNQSAIASIKNPEHHGRMKHVDIHHHWIREKVKNKDFIVQYLPTEEMTADILTKALPRLLVERHRIGLGIM